MYSFVNSIRLAASLMLVYLVAAGSVLAETQTLFIPLPGADDLNAVWAQQDDDDGISLTSSEVEINSLSINVPKDGFLVVSGIVYVNNAQTNKVSFRLEPKIDGINASPNNWVGYRNYPADGAAGDVGTISYTITTPITKGAHIVSQTLKCPESSFYYDGENLTAMYFPSGSLLGKAPLAASTSLTENMPQDWNNNPGDR